MRVILLWLLPLLITPLALGFTPNEEELYIKDLLKELQTVKVELKDLKITKKQVKDLEDELGDLKARLEQVEIKQNGETQELAAEDTIEERVAYLETVANVLRSCDELARNGANETGVYKIDPDGQLIGNDPITVRCIFNDGEDVITEFGHNEEDGILADHCLTVGCFKRAINYSVPIEQIRALMSLSESCSQSISYGCISAPLISAIGENLGGWNGYDGNPQYYFNGDYPGEHICTCGETYSCTSSTGIENVCNCDANLPILESDDGIITSMQSLPITGVFYGPLEYTLQNARFTIGRLQCSGNSVKDSDSTTSCAAMKKAGNFQSGIYSLQTPGEKWPRLSICRMADYNGYEDNSMESSLGYVNIEPEKEKVVFSVYSSKGHEGDIQQGNYVDFEGSWIDNGFPLVDNREFIAPFKGNYEFSFSGHMNNNCDNKYARIEVQLNGAVIHEFYTYDNNDGAKAQMLSSSWIVSLDVGDSIQLYVSDGTLCNYSFYRRSFTGKLIEVL